MLPVSSMSELSSVFLHQKKVNSANPTYYVVLRRVSFWHSATFGNRTECIYPFTRFFSVSNSVDVLNGFLFYLILSYHTITYVLITYTRFVATVLWNVEQCETHYKIHFVLFFLACCIYLIQQKLCPAVWRYKYWLHRYLALGWIQSFSKSLAVHMWHTSQMVWHWIR